jgi:hypothetical protein
MNKNTRDNKKYELCPLDTLEREKSVVVSVDVLNIIVLKYAITVVAKALIPQVPKNASTHNPNRKLNPKN